MLKIYDITSVIMWILVITNQEGRKSMLKLAERMVISFCGGVSASTAHTWTTLSGTGADDVRVMTRKSVDDPGRPPGIVLSAATSFWLPVPPAQVFEFLRNESSRTEVMFFQLLISISLSFSYVFLHVFYFLFNLLNDSGIFFLTVELSKKWRTLQMDVILETVSLSLE